jgi:hypothetical protein
METLLGAGEEVAVAITWRKLNVWSISFGAVSDIKFAQQNLKVSQSCHVFNC